MLRVYYLYIMYHDSKIKMERSRYGRVLKKTQHYEPTLGRGETLTDDYGVDEHDPGLFDDKDETFNSKNMYVRYHVDNMEFSSDSESDDDVKGGDVERELSRMSIESGSSKSSYESSFVTSDGYHSDWTDASYNPGLK